MARITTSQIAQETAMLSAARKRLHDLEEQRLQPNLSPESKKRLPKLIGMQEQYVQTREKQLAQVKEDQPVKIRKKIIILGATAFILSSLFPPWVFTFTHPRGGGVSEKSAGYHLIFYPPPPSSKRNINLYGVEIDFVRLLIQWAVIGVAIAAVTALKRKE